MGLWEIRKKIIDLSEIRKMWAHMSTSIIENYKLLVEEDSFSEVQLIHMFDGKFKKDFNKLIESIILAVFNIWRGTRDL